MTLSVFEDKIRETVTTALSLAPDYVRPEFQQATDFTGDFATVEILQTAMMQHPALSYSDDPIPAVTVTETNEAVTEVIASVNFFGPDAGTLISRLKLLMESQRITQILNRYNIAYRITSLTRDLTGLVGTKWRRRFQCDMTFAILSSESIPGQLTYCRFPFAVDGQSIGTASGEVSVI